jgi:hypothetical protein
MIIGKEKILESERGNNKIALCGELALDERVARQTGMNELMNELMDCANQ